MKNYFPFIGLIALFVLSNAEMQAQSAIVFESSSLQSIVNDSFKQGKYNAEVKLTCEVMPDPPNDCYTSIFFNDKNLPSLLYHGEVKAMTLADINMDGSMECVLFIENMGNWDSIEIFALAKSTKTKKSLWYQPFESFFFYPGFDNESNCDARIFYSEKSKKIEIQTTRLTDEGIDCSEHIFPVWKKLNVD